MMFICIADDAALIAFVAAPNAMKFCGEFIKGYLSMFNALVVGCRDCSLCLLGYPTELINGYLPGTILLAWI